MHGPGHAPPQPPRETTATVVVLRVLFAILPLFSCGLLSWATMLRLSLVTRRTLDWSLFAATLVGVTACFGTVMTDPTEDLTMLRSNVAIALLLAMGVLVMGYYLFAETRHFAAGPSTHHGPRTQAQFGYGYPPHAATAPPYGPTATPVPHAMPTPPPQPQQNPYAVPPRPTATPPPHLHLHPEPQPGPQAPTRPQPARIDQVRAELDELSDLLRKEEGK
ncbi:hypothetical protein ABZ070_12815 [Streptomyces sp. NPDC006283]|uniref:hypothetical protein n=1 Tax=Streptomyces sp. NPDC006283 TaxID=3156741 RepID=UPI0033B8E5D4